MSTSGSVAGDRARSSKKASRVVVEGDFEGFDEPSGVSVSPAGMKIPTPTKFSGRRGTLSEYINQVELYMAFHAKSFTEASNRNLFYLSYLEGDAASALRPQLEEYIASRDPTKMDDDVTKITNDREYVKNQLLALFRDDTEQRRLERQIANLRQRASASEYTSKFRSISTRISWNGAAQMAAYIRGLKDEIKDELARMDSPPNIGSLIQKVHAIDNRLYEREQEKKSSNLGHRPKRRENVSATNSRPQGKSKGRNKKGKKDLSQVECYGCHKKGHYKNKCPRQEQAAVVNIPTCDHQKFQDCTNNDCAVHWGKKDSHLRYQRKLQQQAEEDYAWEEVEGQESSLPGFQVAMVNSEAYVSEDDAHWGPTSSDEEGELVNEEETSDGEGSTGGAWERLAETSANLARTNGDLVLAYRERLAASEAQVTKLQKGLDDANSYAARIAQEHPMNALVDALLPEELARMVGHAGRLGLTAKFDELFHKIAREVSQGERQGLAVIEVIVANEIRKTLQGDGCEDPMDVIHVKIPRGSKFLKNGSVLLPDRRLIDHSWISTARTMSRQVKELPICEKEIHPSSFVGLTELPTESKN